MPTHVLSRYRSLVGEFIDRQLHLVDRISTYRFLPGEVILHPETHSIIGFVSERSSLWSLLDDIRDRRHEALATIYQFEDLRSEALVAGYRLRESPSRMGKILDRICSRCFDVLILDIQEVNESVGVNHESEPDDDYDMKILRLQKTLVPLNDMILCCGDQAVSEIPKSINVRMLEALQEDQHERLNWSQRVWAKYLGCSAPAVAQCPTWDVIMRLRASEQQERRGRAQ